VSKLLDRVKILKNGQIIMKSKEPGYANDGNIRTLNSSFFYCGLCDYNKTNY